jgi:hypothetical protein
MQAVQALVRDVNALQAVHDDLSARCAEAYRLAGRCPSVGSAIYAYKGSTSYVLNAHMRAGLAWHSRPDLHRVHAGLARALARQSWPADGPALYRSLYGAHAQELAGLAAGAHFRNAGYSSFTYDPSVPFTFGARPDEKHIILVLTLCTGCPFVYLDGARETLLRKRYIRWSACTGPGWVEQGEVLLPSGLDFKIVRKRVVQSRRTTKPLTIIEVALTRAAPSKRRT